MTAYIETFKGWAETARQDVAALKAVLESTTADIESRKLAIAALSYLVSRMDLIPDWNEGIGVIDDVMVLRVCAQLITGHNVKDLSADAEVSLGRMTNEAEEITKFLGGPIYDKLKSHCAKLSDASVRGRSPQDVMDGGAPRAALYAEIEDELKKSVPIVVADPADAELRLKSYLTQKLR